MFFEKRIMSSQEQEVILDWMLEVQHKFVSNPMGNHRNYYIFSDDPSAPKVLLILKKGYTKKKSWVKFILNQCTRIILVVF